MPITAAFPGQVAQFTDKIDLVDTVFAAHINALQAEVHAIELLLGTNPLSGLSGDTLGEVLSTLTTETAQVLTAIAGALVPAGSIIGSLAGSTPAGYLYCAGQSVSRSQYPTLYSIIGTEFGTADNTHFNLPNLIGYFLKGASVLGAVSPGDTHNHTTGDFSLQGVHNGAHNHGASQDGHAHALTVQHQHGGHTQGHSHVVGPPTIAVRAGTDGVALGGPDSGSASRGGFGTSAQGDLGSPTDYAYGGNTDVRQPNVYTSNSGNGQAHNHGQTGTSAVLNPPSLSVNYFIKY